jgi:hypothetical protein
MQSHLKFNLLVAAAAALLFVSSCEKNDSELEPKPEPEPEQVEDTPGNIAGLGETSGEPTGTPFRLPDGIETAGKIMGGYNQYNYQSAGTVDKQAALRQLKSIGKGRTVRTRSDGESVPLDTIVGSGSYVGVFIPLRNITSHDILVTFPAALILKSVSGECQNGVLLKKVTVNIPAGRICGVLLLMYCGNENLYPSYWDEEYVFTVVSNSSLITDLCDRVKNKRINNEEYPLDPNGYADDDQYFLYESHLQEMLWKLTDDGEPLSEEDIAYIEQMENS